MSTLAQDLRYGFRMLMKSPGFTVVAVVTLALGIGANTAMFSVVYGVLLRPLPYPDPERIVEISRTMRGELTYSGFDASAYDFWREHREPFQYLAASTGSTSSLVGGGRPERIEVRRVSPEYFDVHGINPLLGRSFQKDENRIGGPNVAVLNYALWQSHFGGDRNAIGRTVLLDGTPYTVIGVMPASFAGVHPAQLWTTIEPVRNTVGGGMNFHIDARLKPDVSAQRATSYLASLAQSFREQHYQWMPEKDRQVTSFQATPYVRVMTKDARTPLLVLFAAIGFVLLIACVNVANLMLARTATREREIALRTALGAGRGRIVRQLLTESVLLALFGAALGLLIAFWGLNSLLALAPDALPRAQDVALNGWALLFTGGVAVLTGILFGLAPALQAWRANLNDSLKEGETRATSGLHGRRLSAAMVSAEIALSLLLLIGAGLLIRTFASLLSTDPGFNPRGLLTLEIWTTGSKFNSTPALSNFYEELVKHVEAVPGVKSAALVAAGLPIEGGGNLNPGVRVEGRLDHPSVDYREVTPEYFRTLGVPVLSGRFFTPGDSGTSAKVAVINAAFARKYFHDRNPIGQSLTLEPDTLEIVGVVGDVRSSLNEPAPPTFFVPVAQADFSADQQFQAWFPTSILVRTNVKPLTLSRAVEDAVRDASPDIPIGRVRSMEEVLALSLALQRLQMTLMGIFAGLALVLAAVGIYGVLSYWVRQRTHEIGVRMALGAARRDVLGMVVKQGATLAALGIAAGLAAAFGLTRLMASLLYGVRPTDPLTFALVSLVLAGVAMLATYIPARRATKVDPMVALRYE